MLRKLAAVAAIIASVSTLVSAEISFDTPKNTNLQQEIANLDMSVPQAVIVEDKAVSPKADKEWTIMVFVNGKNNLEPYALKDMNEMEQVGSSDKVNVVAETGLIAGYGALPWTGTARFLIKKDADTNKVTSPILANLGTVDMGDYKSVIDFVNWAKTTYPAKKYMLVIWNHGAGWIKSRSPEVTKGISYDDQSGNHINTPQMGLMMKAIGKLDVYGSDACLMQMPEVDYEIMPYVDYIVGSEETEPGDGYTYNTFLGPVIANPTMDPMTLAKQAVNAYSDHYGTQDNTQSLVKSAALPGFVTATNDFVAAAMATSEKALVKTALASAQAYAYAENKDLWHFLSLYGASTKDATVKAKAKALQGYLDTSLVLLNRANAKYANSHGLAIYMPNTPNSAYNDLAWAKVSKWDEFITWYTTK
jgi:hypothetical protein